MSEYFLVLTNTQLWDGSNTAIPPKTATTPTCAVQMVVNNLTTYLIYSLPLLTSSFLTPRKVKYWALGNECWGDWQVEQLTKENYAKKAYQWAKALKLLDPTIQLILCGQDGTSTWDHYVLQKCITSNQHALGNQGCLIEMHSIHMYTADENHLKNATGESPP